MGIARRLAGGVARRLLTRLLDRAGGRLVAGMTDTSSDAPSGGFAPKRDLYRQMVSGEAGDRWEDPGDR